MHLCYFIMIFVVNLLVTYVDRQLEILSLCYAECSALLMRLVFLWIKIIRTRNAFNDMWEWLCLITCLSVVCDHLACLFCSLVGMKTYRNLISTSVILRFVVIASLLYTTLLSNITYTIILWYSALTLLVGCQEEHPACKNWVMRCWCGYLSGAWSRLHIVQLMPLPSPNPITSSLI